MAKTTGTQSIPSALLPLYKAVMAEANPEKRVGKRYPFRVPPMQTEKGHPSKKQKTQRDAFLVAVAAFNNTDAATRQRWWENEPEWNSFLWYYNYFLMSSLNDEIVVGDGVIGVIKSIQHKTISIPTGSGEGSVAITAVDVDKAIVMIQGGTVAVEDNSSYGYAGAIMPYVSSIASTLVKAKWALPVMFGNNAIAATVSIIVIEYI